MLEWFWPQAKAPNTALVRFARVVHWLGYGAALFLALLLLATIVFGDSNVSHDRVVDPHDLLENLDTYDTPTEPALKPEVVFEATLWILGLAIGGRATRYIIANE